ncbi:MAG: flavodoxin domain-containing protein [Anaerolineae bacterium]
MSSRVLVTYATRYGSTREVAEAVAATLRERGLDAAVEPAKDVISLDAYGAVVLGAPLYIGSWHKDVDRFLTRHREALAGRPLAIFALGPLDMDEKGWQGARDMLDKALAKTGWLTPVSLELFGGKYGPAKLNLLDKIIAALPASPLHGLPASDVRDWAAIRAWASDLAAKLQPAPPR